LVVKNFSGGSYNPIGFAQPARPIGTGPIDMDQPAIYRIRIKGHLNMSWLDWFDGLTITRLDNGETVREGPAIDQAALHGMLNHIRDLGLLLLTVDRVELANDIDGGGQLPAAYRFGRSRLSWPDRDSRPHSVFSEDTNHCCRAKNSSPPTADRGGIE
jgi:hypothetical protein